jgi:phosphate-selective porin OprO and OprP
VCNSFRALTALLSVIMIFHSATALTIGGRVQEDIAFFKGAGKKDAGTNQFPNGTNLKNADLIIKGAFSPNIDFLTQLKLSTVIPGGQSHLERAYASFKSDNIHFNVGQQYFPFSLEHTTNLSELVFMQQSASVAAVTNRRWFGLNVGFYTDMFTANVSVGTRGLGEVNPGANPGSDKYAYLARVTAMPWSHDNGVLHIGLDMKQRYFNTQNTDGSAVPNFNVGKTNTIEMSGRSQTGNILFLNVNDRLKSTRTYVGEFATDYKGFNFQAEYFNQKLKFFANTPTQNVKTWYITTAMVVTGERRSYNHEKGVFTDPVPEHKYGALELALRYSFVNMRRHDGNNVPVGLNGGKQNAWTGGVNWFVTDQVKFQLNYVRARFDYKPAANSKRVLYGYGLGMQLLF